MDQTQVEKWLKIATDNKINQNNSWSVQLIDYFYQLHHQKSAEVNFTQASCTLDGCVKVYSTRVDAVFTETGRLLNGLVSGGDADDKADDDHQEDQQKAAKRRKVQTIEKKEALTMKKFDLDYRIDPLFKKICADFDETGSNGLLLNHLKLQGVCKLTFSSYDQLVDGYEAVVQLNERVPFSEEYRQSTFISPSLAGFNYLKPLPLSELVKTSELDDYADDYVEPLEEPTDVYDEPPTEFQEPLPEPFTDQITDHLPEQDENQQPDKVTPSKIHRMSVVNVASSDALTYFDPETEREIETKRMLRSGKQSVIGLKDVKPVKTPRKKQVSEVKISFVQLLQKGITKPAIDTDGITIQPLDETADYTLPVQEEFSEMQLYSMFMRPHIDARTFMVEQEEFVDDEPEQIDFDIYDAPLSDHVPSQELAEAVEQLVQDQEVKGYQLSAMAANANALNYSKRAKRVDVKQLKQHIWNYLSRGQDKFEGVKSFTDIYQAVQRVYPPHVARDITPPFYFICLLHLANEQVLKIDSVVDMNQLFISCD